MTFWLAQLLPEIAIGWAFVAWLMQPSQLDMPVPVPLYIHAKMTSDTDHRGLV